MSKAILGAPLLVGDVVLGAATLSVGFFATNSYRRKL